MKKNGKNEKKGITSIKFKLIALIIPLVILTISILLNITYKKSREMIVNYAQQLVQALTVSNEHEIETWSQDIISGLNQIKNTIDAMELKDDELLGYLKTTMNKNDSYKNGVYIGEANNKIVDPSGWIPDKNYVVTERDWYKEGLQNEEKFNFGKAYLDEDTGEYVISATAKLKSIEGISRVAGADVSLKTISDIVGSKSILNTGRLFLVDSANNKIIAIGEEELIHTEFNDNNQNELIRDIAKHTSMSEKGILEVTSGGDTYSICVQTINHTPWKLIGYISYEEVLASLKGFQKAVLGIFILTLILLIVLIERTIHHIIKPIKSLNHTIHRITEGDFTSEVKVKGNDEIATIGRSMKRFIETMREIIREVNKMSDKLEQQAENSSHVAIELYESAEVQSTSMSELNQTVDELARAVTEVAENTSTLSMVVAETDQSGQEASEKMKNTVSLSEKGKADMGQVSLAVKNLDETVEKLIESVEEVDNSSEKINGIVELIGNIANQTNLLALNAAIEAARAGEAGRGFSVVAEEIRKLAETSQQSVKSITHLTSNIKNLVNNTIDKSQQSAKSIKQSIELVATAEDTYGVIYSMLNETNAIVQEMIQKVSKVDEVASSVAAITQEQSAAAEQILATSENLSNHAKKVTNNSYRVEKDAAELSETAENLNNQMKLFKI
ncbi:chemotaxis protein [Sporanaerobium hydrogeniformans]|uniref:Chemotaxis protein n=1 Tax=Sporanaerobium hydrogeniformans TaxID=3072179 RepID=A0AC61DAM8_9FIRM|nr:methyl-accepting chemotaxis protein [Sporanaerobium hydrogeniformans]PHV69791.1 chemotaxis protein [Sporanaerobium hydrogeniformans]